ncbi:MAG: AIR synthase related protein [Aggregatilineales bacterium]
MHFRIVLAPHAELDVRGVGVVQAAHTLGIGGLRSVRVSELYFVRGQANPLTMRHVTRLCELALADPAAHTLTVGQPNGTGPTGHAAHVMHSVEVAYLPGVMDPLALQLARAAGQIGLPPIEVATGTRYELFGDLTTPQLLMLTERLLCNVTIQRYGLGTIEPAFSAGERTPPRVESIRLAGLSDSALATLSKTRLLSLSVDEMRAIQNHFESLGRAPTDVELETLAQTWSEHCVHKTFKAIIEYTNENGEVEIIDGLLNSTIRRATEEINAPWVRSAFVDNAGIIAFDDKWDLSFKVETHNHPSALEPFGGANTGVGGVIRDIMGVSARPIAVTDVLCFGPQDLPFDQLPAGTLHPRRVKEGVVAGVQDYGNKLGIPTVAGAVYYDPGYTANPLVFAGCVGIAPRDSHPTGAKVGDYVIVIGGRTGRDGLHGATFSSDALAHNTGQVAGAAVQIGNPITQKDVMEVIVRARDAKLYTAINDCGAGGLSSAVGEMAYQTSGVEVELTSVPLKYPGLRPWEIWLSEAQERMVLAVNPAQWAKFQTLCADWDVEATRIGTFTNSGRLIVRYSGNAVADLSLAFMKDGRPRLRLKAVANPNIFQWRVKFSEKNESENFESYLLHLLCNPNWASKEDILRRYDHEVRGGTIIKPLAGMNGDGPSDAAVIKPLESSENNIGFALGIGLCIEWGRIDPYRMAYAAVNEAVANVIAVGADPDRIALLDNFCWGDPKDSERLGALVEAAKGCHDAALEYRTPFVSGKDSLNNIYIGLDGKRSDIPDTLVISAIGIVPDVTRAVTMDLKRPGNRLYIYITDINEDRLSSLRVLHGAIQNGAVVACHNISGAEALTDGAIYLSLAKMCIAGQYGAQLSWESFTRLSVFNNNVNLFIVELAANSQLSDGDKTHFLYIGNVSDVPNLQVIYQSKMLTDLPISELTAAYKRQGKYAT